MKTENHDFDFDFNGTGFRVNVTIKYHPNPNHQTRSPAYDPTVDVNSLERWDGERWHKVEDISEALDQAIFEEALDCLP